MKYSLFILFSGFILFSCSKKKANVKDTLPDAEMIDDYFECNISQSIWFEFYRKFNPDFRMEDFEKISEDSFFKMELPNASSMINDIDSIYYPFLIWNDDSSSYIDIDSYLWWVENGEIYFNNDQEIKWVDVVNKKAYRIAFRGPSYWTEDAIWCGDEIYLLDNSDEKLKFVTKIDLKNNMITTLQHPDSFGKNDYFTYRKSQLSPHLQF